MGFFRYLYRYCDVILQAFFCDVIVYTPKRVLFNGPHAKYLRHRQDGVRATNEPVHTKTQTKLKRHRSHKNS